MPSHVTVHMYEKGRTTDITPPTIVDSPRSTFVSVRLPNVGRESHTYLEHVIRTRAHAQISDGPPGSRADTSITVFLQGGMRDHVPMPHTTVSYVQALVDEASCSDAGESRNHACHSHFGAFNAWPGMRAAMFARVGDSGQTFREWFEGHISPWIWTDVSQGPSWWQNGVFAVRTCRFWSVDEEEEAQQEDGGGDPVARVYNEFFEMLRGQVAWHVNPEQGHFFERSWHHVFPPLLRPSS